MEFKDFQGLPLKFKDFSRLCEPYNPGPITKYKLLSGNETTFRRALISNIKLSLALDRELWVGTETDQRGKE